MLRRLAPVVVVLVLAVAGCDSGAPQPSSTPPSTPAGTSTVPVTAGLLTDIAALYAGQAPSKDEGSEAACFADALLERLDTDALAAAGIVDADGAVVAVLPVLDRPSAEAWVAAQRDCADFVDVSARALFAQSKGKVDREAYAACLHGALTTEAIDAALVNTLSGGFDSPEVRALSGAQGDCARSASPSD